LLNTDRQLKSEPNIAKILGAEKPTVASDSTLSRALQWLCPDELKALWGKLLHKIRRNKVYQSGTIGGYRVAAIDMTGTGHSEKLSCSLCHGNIHKVVFSYIIGADPHIFLGLEVQKPGEGETSAAQRLLQWIHQTVGNWIDIFAVDALYKAPFINAAIELGYHVVIRTEEVRLKIIEDAIGLFSQREPDITGVDPDRLYQYKIWDSYGFTTWTEVNVPLRVLQVEELHIKEGTISRYWIITTLQPQHADTLTVKEIAHCRWHIENNAFHNMKTYWHLNHTLCHQDNAFLNALWFRIIAYSLFMLFFFRHLFHLAAQLRVKKIMLVHLIPILERSLALPLHPT